MTGNGAPRPGPPASLAAGDPVVRFLGPAAMRNGPFGVLGLPVRPVGDEDVLGAVHAAMARIDGHPESRTPAADEARLAVHAAAANLLDRAVQGELLRRLVSRDMQRAAPGAGPAVSTTPAATAKPGAVPPVRRSVTPRTALLLEADLLRSIAAEGGWSRRAMDRFMKVAHARGHGPAEAAGAIRHIAHHKAPPPEPPSAHRVPAAPTRPAAPAETASARSASEPPASPADAQDGSPPQHGGISPFGAAVLIGAVFLAMVVGGWFAFFSVRGGGGPTAPRVVSPAPAPAPSPRAEAKPAPPAPEPGRRVLDNGPAIVHELEVAMEGLSIDVGASIAGFEAAVDAMSRRWVEVSTADRLAAQDQIVGYVYRVSSQGALTDRALNALEAGTALAQAEGERTAADVRRSAWSMGTLVRLRREQNLPSVVMRRLDRVLLRAPEGLGPNASTFRAGAIAALRAAAGSLAGRPVDEKTGEVWGAWAEAVRAAATGDEALSESVILGAIETVLRSAPVELSAGSGEAVGTLVGELSWRAGGAARAWLLRSFADRTISTADLHALTLALATRSGAEGVDPSMVLSRGASEYDRRSLGERYRAMWGLDVGADQGEAVAALAGVAAEALRGAPPADGRDEAEVLGSIVRFARLNAATALLWRAETAAATELLGTLDDPIDAVLESGQAADARALFAAGTGTWAETYLNEGAHIPRRLELLEGLASRSGRLEPMEAEVVVIEAVRGSPQRVRDAAAAAVEAMSDQPTIVNAVLEALPMMPLTERNARIIEIASGASMPPVDSPAFPGEARRALVERLLELIAGGGPYARLDALAGLLNEAYWLRLNGPASSGSSSPAMARQSARALAERWAADAEARPPAGLAGLGVDEIERRRSARLAMASGLVQEFHVEQLALTELMAQAVASEQPDRASAVRTLIDELDLARARSRGVLLQIELTERAMLSLWRMRLGEGAA